MVEFSRMMAGFRVTLSTVSEDLVARHGAVLGLCAFLAAFPHQVPDFLPELLLFLGRFINAGQPSAGFSFIINFK